MINAIKVVLDTNILVSALWSTKSNPSKIVNMIPNRLIIPHFCDDIFSEYKDVLFRPMFNFNHDDVYKLLELFILFGKTVDVLKSSIALPDESDRVFYDVAKESESILITGNIKHFPYEPFIMTPAIFLQSL